MGIRTPSPLCDTIFNTMPSTHPEAVKAREYRKTKKGGERSRAAARAYHKRIAKIIRAAKRGPCQECGVRLQPIAMVLHHRDPQYKRFELSEWRKRFPLKSNESKADAVRAEIQKCDLLCPTCHLSKHTV